MVEQLPLPGPLKGYCEGIAERCSRKDCPMYGSLLKASKDGRHRIKGCGDIVKRNTRNRSSGLGKQRVARKALGIPPNKFGDSNEERWADPLFANEIKSGAQVRPAATAYLNAERQILSNEPDHGGQRKPARVTIMPENFSGDGIVMVRLSTWRELIRPALEDYYGRPY